MKFSFHPDAEREFDEAVVYYERSECGLGIEFAEEVYATISRISQYPKAGTKASQKTRRCLTNRFPFGVIYQAKADAIRVIAVANLNRRPGYWRERMRQSP
jgi:toxin ParE1/3/4